MTISLTTNEEKVLKVLEVVERQYIEGGEPGFSDVMLDDITAETNMNTKTAKGVVGSLIKKDMVFAEDVNDEYNIYYLTTKAKKFLKMEE